MAIRLGVQLTVSKMPAPFHGATGDPIDVQRRRAVHLFDPAGPCLATTVGGFAR